MAPPEAVTHLAALQHECSVGLPGGFVERLRRGTYLAHITEHVCIELQNLMGFSVGFGKARNAGERSLYQLIVAYEEAEPAKAAVETALRLTLAAMHDEPIDLSTRQPMPMVEGEKGSHVETPCDGSAASGRKGATASTSNGNSTRKGRD